MDFLQDFDSDIIFYKFCRELRTHVGAGSKPVHPTFQISLLWKRSEDLAEDYLNILHEYIDNYPASWQLDEKYL
jgi:hypothetical protein